MIRQGYKRILIIGMVLILLFSTMTGSSGREEATTPAETTLSEEEIAKQSLLQQWQSVITEGKSTVNTIYWIQPIIASRWYGPVEETAAIQEMLVYLKNLAPTFTHVQKIDDNIPPYSYGGYAFYEHVPASYPSVFTLHNKSDTEAYFLLGATMDGALKITDSTFQWELYTAPGTVDTRAFDDFMIRHFYD